MWRKLLNILFKIAIVLLTFLLVSLLVVQKLFPPEQIKKILISEMELALNRKVVAGDLYLNPFKGIRLEDVRIFEKATPRSSASDSNYFFSVKTIYLNYRWSALLKREVQINDILIDSPVINLVQDQALVWNFQDLIQPDSLALDSTGQAIEDTLAGAFTLPVTVALKKLTLKNIVVNLEMDQIDTRLKINSGGITFQLADLFLPRQSFETALQQATANLAVFSNNTPWQISYFTKSDSSTTEIYSRLLLNLAAQFNGTEKISGTAEIAMADVRMTVSDPKNPVAEKKQFPLPQLFALAFDINADAQNESVEIKKLAARIGNETLFNLTGTVSDFIQQPNFDLALSESQIRFQEIFSAFVPLLPDSIKTELEQITLSGTASLNGTKIWGKPLSTHSEESLTIDLKFKLNNLNFRYAEPLTELSNINLALESQVNLDAESFQQGKISALLTIDSLSLASDTMNYVFDNFVATIEAKLDRNFLPEKLNAKFTVADFFDVPLELKLDFSSTQGLVEYLAKVELNITDLPLAQLTEATVDGTVNVDFSLVSQTLDNIQGSLTVATDILEVAAEDERLIISPLDLFGDFVLSTDTSFNQIQLTALHLQLGDFASLMARGNFLFNLVPEVTVSIDELVVDHQRALQFLPEQLLEGLETLRIGGSSSLTATLLMKLPENQESILDATARLNIIGNLDYPDQLLKIGAVVGQVDIRSDGLQADTKMAVKIDSLTLAGVIDQPLNDISISAWAALPDFETIKLDSALASIPSLRTNLRIVGRIDSLSGLMTANAKTNLKLDTASDTITVMNDIRLQGKIEQQSDINLLGDLMSFAGRLRIENLNVDYADLAQIEAISGEIYFNEQFDILNSILVEGKEEPSWLADAGDFYYDLLRPYYQENYDKFSYLRIKKIRALDYLAEDIDLDLLIQNTQINVSRFALNLYDGNLSGVVSANLHTGNPEDIDWKIKANLSRLNSAKLLPGRKEKTSGSDLNMNLELAGRGVDIEQEIYLDGYFYVTKIGPKFTDNLLKSLDSKGADKSIQDTRRLLNWGYKPKLISFEVKHNNLYPAIHLVKGNLLTKLIPLNLSGGKIELARIPIKILLANFQIEPQ